MMIFVVSYIQMEGSKIRSGPTAEDPFFMMLDLVEKMDKIFIKKSSIFFKKGVAIYAGLCYYIVTGNENPEREGGTNDEGLERNDHQLRRY